MKNTMKTIIAIMLAALLICLSFSALAEGDNYIEYTDDTLVEGENIVNLDGDYDYTVFAFRPTRIGKYTFTSLANIALASANGMWVTIDLSTETVNAQSFEWTCTDENQSIYIAVESAADHAVINIGWEEYVVVIIPRTPYENKATLSAFDFPYAESSLKKVDINDDVLNEAVLGEDGYYHLDSVDGPILYANLDDAAMSLSNANSFGQLVYPIYEDGKLVSKIDYTDAFTEYEAVADADTLLYPLTEDIIAIFQNVGEANAWYGEDGWIGGELDDAWMFACYWKPEYNGLGDVNKDGTINQYDYILVKRHYFETRMLTDDELSRADINDDDSVDQFDYILIMRHYFGTYLIG